MFRQGSKNGHAVYWSDPDEPTDRLVGMAMTAAAAEHIAVALNRLHGMGYREFVEELPTVPKREPSP